MYSVLVVDDEPLVRLSIAGLRAWGDDGFDFLAEAANGAEALDLIAARPEIDIVLLDLTMPVMDGIEFLKRLSARETGRTPVVVVLSAHDDYHLVREAFTLGASDYLLKSEIDAEALKVVLDKAAAKIATSGENATIIQRRHIQGLKLQVLRDLVIGPAPKDLTGLEEAFAGLGITIELPFAVCCFWVEDLEAVSKREGKEANDGLARFSEMLARSLGQALAKWGRGDVVPVEPGHAAVLFSPPHTCAPGEGELEAAARAFCADAAEYVGRYLSVKLSSSPGPACRSVKEVAESYRSARAARTVVSRIVVLAKRAIRERFADPSFSLEEASERAGVSKNHLCSEFSRETGETFIEYLTRIRIEEAKRLLATTSLLVYEVGERVGYPNVEHFSRVFKKVIGVSPVRFKAELGASDQSSP